MYKHVLMERMYVADVFLFIYAFNLQYLCLLDYSLYAYVCADITNACMHVQYA